MQTIKVLLADDQILFVESLKTVLEIRAPDIEVIGIAYDGKQVLDMLEKKHPDVLLLDIRMPEINGVECTKIITQKYPDLHIMMLTTFDNDEYIIDALKYGAVGYLLKDVNPSFLIDAIHSVYNGGLLISPTIAKKIVTKFNTSIDVSSSLTKELTPREKEVLTEISKGFTNKEIAGSLGIAEQTVKNHVSMIYSKLNVHDRMQAYLIAKKAGLNSEID